MQPFVYWSQWAWLRWVGAAVVAGFSVLGWLLYRWGLDGWPLMFPAVWASLFWSRHFSFYVISHGVLVVRGFQEAVVPLATAEVERRPIGWVVRWPGRHRQQEVRILYEPGLDPVLEEAAAAARGAAARGEAVPGTEAEAAGRVAAGTVPWGSWTAVVAAVVAVGLWWLAMWLRQPLVLLPLAVVPVMRGRPQPVLVLAGDNLWLVRPGRAAVQISLEGVRLVRKGLWPVLVAERPEGVRLQVEWGLGRRLGKLLAARASGSGTGSAGGAARCSLCGCLLEPEPGAVGRPVGVQYCDVCARRVRKEAQEGGHGTVW